MSVREDDQKKNGCSSRGVAIAATALGVGLGAAFYYLFNKRQETPNSAGSTSHWNDEPPPFRQRGWTLEECSICFDVMLRNQDITSLPCAHNFHTECILPWLQEKQTCPNCRKVAEWLRYMKAFGQHGSNVANRFGQYWAQSLITILWLYSFFCVFKNLPICS